MDKSTRRLRRLWHERPHGSSAIRSRNCATWRSALRRACSTEGLVFTSPPMDVPTLPRDPAGEGGDLLVHAVTEFKAKFRVDPHRTREGRPERQDICDGWPREPVTRMEWCGEVTGETSDTARDPFCTRGGLGPCRYSVVTCIKGSKRRPTINGSTRRPRPTSAETSGSS
jgi:hypothetical protein